MVDLYAVHVPLTVVLVDDVPEVRRLVRTALRVRGGFTVIGEATDGTQAIELAETHQPDLVVLDLGLPDLAGREVLAGIRRLSPRTRVVVFSGTETADRQWIRDNVEGFALKDVDLDYLVDLLESVGRERTGEAVLNLPCELASIAAAREFVRDRLVEWGVEAQVDDALVVASELVTNAIMHAESPCELRLWLSASAIRVEVLDDGAGTPEPRTSSDTDEGGRGLHLIAALAAAWGIEQIPDDGKVVWAELARLAS